MDHIDAKVFMLIAMAVVATVGALKRAWPAWVGGKEEFLSIVLPVAFVIAAKIVGGFKGTGWVDALVWAFASGPTAGLLHDKVLDPVVKFGTKSADQNP